MHNTLKPPTVAQKETSLALTLYKTRNSLSWEAIASELEITRKTVRKRMRTSLWTKAEIALIEKITGNG